MNRQQYCAAEKQQQNYSIITILGTVVMYRVLYKRITYYRSNYLDTASKMTQICFCWFQLWESVLKVDGLKFANQPDRPGIKTAKP